MSERVRVVVADDHPMIRDGVVRALERSGNVEVVAEAKDGREALAAIERELPDVALVDFRMPAMDGAEVAAAVRRNGISTKVLLLSAHTESAIVYNAIAQGAYGFVSKEAAHTQIVDAVIDCAGGRPVLAADLAAGSSMKSRPAATARHQCSPCGRKRSSR